jgi:tRNA/tmRNA/rRNA uracil-C5-methylase (TrmA/RlmC/RlmD family)
LSSGKTCTLCHASRIDYDRELAIKNDAFRDFWTGLQTGIPPTQVHPSPLGRGYRSVTKRRVFRQARTVALGLISPSDDGTYEPAEVSVCAIEPPIHGTIYSHVRESLPKPHLAPLASVLNYVIIKGSTDDCKVVLNVSEISSAVVGAVNTLSKALTRSFTSITGVFLFEDRGSGKYYMGQGGRSRPATRRVYGSGISHHTAGGLEFEYPALSFTQVNHSILDSLIAKARELSDLSLTATLYDLYSGYGLFALSFAAGVRSIVAVEISRESVDAARANAGRQGVRNARFLRTDITADSLPAILRNLRHHDRVLLDPPRNGAAPGVIECIAAKKPDRVLHLFCNPDTVASELTRWKLGGYAVAAVEPFDMFPGTSSMEIVVLLVRVKGSFSE